jgi:hypothetical protein
LDHNLIRKKIIETLTNMERQWVQNDWY